MENMGNVHESLRDLQNLLEKISNKPRNEGSNNHNSQVLDKVSFAAQNVLLHVANANNIALQENPPNWRFLGSDLKAHLNGLSPSITKNACSAVSRFVVNASIHGANHLTINKTIRDQFIYVRKQIENSV